MQNHTPNNTDVEVRCFGVLREISNQRGWPFPLPYALDRECSAIELAEALAIPLEKIEAVFVNHHAMPPPEARVKPGDRITLLPHGMPGPYRVLLGIVKLPGEQQT
ncbi:MAG TPA: hypothetical protein VGK02_00910 [Candidatus Aquicultor sp.]|jgi:hypothetical protein